MANLDHINRIVKSTVNEALAHGWWISVSSEGVRLLHNSTDRGAIVEHILSVDESAVTFHSGNESKGGFYFVFDCDGYDCINDMTVGLDESFPLTMSLVDKLGG